MDDQVKCCFNPQLWLRTGCLCGVSDTEMPDASIILRNARNLNVCGVQGEEERKVDDESLMTTASTLLVLWDFTFFCGNSSSEIQTCSKLLTLLMRLQQDSSFLMGVQQMVCSTNKFVSYIGSKLLARLLLTSPPEGKATVEHLVLSLVDNSSLISSTASKLTVLQKVLQHSHTTVHPHLAEHQRLAELSSSRRTCNNSSSCVTVDCSEVQCYVVEYVHSQWSCLLLRFLLHPVTEGLISDSTEVSHYQSADDQECVALKIRISERKEAIVGATSFLRLWEYLYKFITASPAGELQDLLTKHYMVCKNWEEIFSVIWLLPTEAGNLLLSIINNYLQYPSVHTKVTAGITQDQHHHQLAEIILNWSSTTCVWDKIPVYTSVHGFGGVKAREQLPKSKVVESVDSRFTKGCLLIFKAAAILRKVGEYSILIEIALRQVHDHSSQMESNRLVEVFSFEDDYLAEVLLCCLELYLNDDINIWIKEWLNPHVLFQSFVKSISYDHNVVIDLIMSNDNCFLLYFLRYLKILVCDVCEPTNLPVFPKMEAASTSRVSTDFLRASDEEIGNTTKILVEYSSSSDNDSEVDSEEVAHAGRLEEKGEHCDSATTSIDFQAILNLCADVQCMISKLHTKGMFPFNPRPLLKLLENLSQFNKMEGQ